VSGEWWSVPLTSHRSLPVLVTARRQLTLDVVGNQLNREEVTDVTDFRVGLELAEVSERHTLPQLRQALVGDSAVLHEVRVALEDRFREQLAARDLDPELT